MFTRIKHEDVLATWPILLPMLTEWTQYCNGEYTPQDLLQESEEGKRDFWVAFDGNGIHSLFSTFAATTPQKRVFVVHVAAGDQMKMWLPEVAREFEQEAKRAGCDAVQIIGRRGWEKTLRPYGMRQVSTVFELDLKGNAHGRIEANHDPAAAVHQ